MLVSIKVTETVTELAVRELLESMGIEFEIKPQVKRKRKNAQVYQATGKKVTNLPLQAKICLEALVGDLTLSEWANAAVKAGLKTKQDPERIIMYYRPQLIGEGYVVMKTQETPETEG
jgi:hypothetical protein